MGSLQLWNSETKKPRHFDTKKLRNQETEALRNKEPRNEKKQKKNKKPRNQETYPPTPQQTDSHPCTRSPSWVTRGNLLETSGRGYYWSISHWQMMVLISVTFFDFHGVPIYWKVHSLFFTPWPSYLAHLYYFFFGFLALHLPLPTENLGKRFAIFGHLLGQFMEQICLKAPYYYFAPSWTYNFSIWLWENPQTLNFYDFGASGRVLENQNHSFYFRRHQDTPNNPRTF